MSKFTSIVGITPASNTPITPTGLLGLKLTVEQETEKAFFRQKLVGAINFSNENFSLVKPLEGVCCQTIPFTIYRSCNSTPSQFVTARFKTNQMEWDFDSCSAKLQNLEVKDGYIGVYKFWEKKINMCSLGGTRILKYNFRHEYTQVISGTDYKYNEYIDTQNPRGTKFTEWIFFCIQKTLTGTEYEGLIPTSYQSLGEFFSMEINPCTGKENHMKNALIFQASDALYPQSIQRATGLDPNGVIIEDLSVTLKDLFENIRIAFDLYWYIDINTGKIRVEHLAFFENGLSYTANNGQISIDLSSDKYKGFTSNYKHSYKFDTGDLYGIEELHFTGNEAIGKSNQAVLTAVNVSGSNEQPTYYSFNRVTDFEHGNIKYDADCVSIDENGFPKKLIQNVDIFITHWEAIRLVDESVDKNKWIIVDVSEIPPTDTNIGVIDGNEIWKVNSAVCERTTLTVSNGSFSATSIMRDFKRWKKSFSKGLMNYTTSPNGLIGKGYVRDMYSVLRTKRYKALTIPFCCLETAFNPYLPIILPNGQKSQVSKAEFNFADETLTIEPLQNSNCGFTVRFPADVGTNYPTKGTVLGTEDIKTYCNVKSYVDSGYGCMEFPMEINGTRTIYADGNGGSYTEDAFDLTPCDYKDPNC